MFIKESKPENHPPGINWDLYTLLLVAFLCVFILREVSSVLLPYLSPQAPVALLDDRPYVSPSRGRLLPLTATSLNTLRGHIQRAALSSRLPGAQSDNFSATFDCSVAALPQNLREWVVAYVDGCSSFLERFEIFPKAIKQAAASLVTQKQAWKNLILAPRLGLN